MEQAFHAGGLLEKPYKAAKDTVAGKREDVDLIVRVLRLVAYNRLSSNDILI